ncbi:MAG TPA: DUF3606 domain-containing protein [Burkholderiales bacterium]|nr:DUF3606 domain-containing protein [Burkholderiales bacterium]
MESRIDVNDIENLRYWSDKLRASEEELRRAVDQVGPQVEDVREHLFGGFTTAGPTS